MRVATSHTIKCGGRFCISFFALRQFSRACSLSLMSVTPHFLCINLYDLLGVVVIIVFMTKYIDAINKWQKRPYSFEELVNLAAQTDRLNNLGASNYKSGNFEISKSYFRQALEIYPHNDDALKNLCILTISDLRNTSNTNYLLEYWQEVNSILNALEFIKNKSLKTLKIALVILDGILREDEPLLDEAHYPIKKLHKDCEKYFGITDINEDTALSAVMLVDKSYAEIIQMITPPSSNCDFIGELSYSFGGDFERAFFCIYEKYRVNRRNLEEAMKQIISTI